MKGGIIVDYSLGSRARLLRELVKTTGTPSPSIVETVLDDGDRTQVLD